jgi:RNA polymerase sigma-70 factor (ECF subfamily)
MELWYFRLRFDQCMPHAPQIRSGSNSKQLQLQALSDEEIMQAVQQGDGDAFAVLFDRFHRLVLVTALKIVHDVAEAEEVTQSVFLEIYREAKQFNPTRGTLKVWLLQFAYHRSINRRNYLVLRQFYNRTDIQDAADWECLAPASPRLPAQEATRLAQEALAMLNEQQRKTIQMVFFEGLSLRDVAEKTGTPLSNVRNFYYRGLERIRLTLLRSKSQVDCEAVPTRGVGRAKA